jgi:hypothetical protein
MAKNLVGNLFDFGDLMRREKDRRAVSSDLG